MSSSNGYEKVELTGLPTTFFLLNRQNYIKNLQSKIPNFPKNAYLFLKGGQELYRYDNDDDFHYFIQESNFYYLTGVLEMNYYATISLDDGVMSLYVPQPTEREKIFIHVETLEEIAQKYNCQAFDLLKMPQEINRLNPSALYVLNGVNSDSGLKIQSCDYTFNEPYEKLNELIDYNELIYEILADTRTRKTTQEIELMTYINKISVEGYIHTMKSIYKNVVVDKKRTLERDVENFFYGYTSMKLYTRNHAFEAICAAGTNSATLHYINNDQELIDGQLILMDMGAEAGGYISDITATVPVNGKFTDRQKEIYNIVLDANKEVLKTAKPGVSWVDCHKTAEKIILTGLQNLGFLKAGITIDELMTNRICYYFLPCGLGHFIGLDTHDVGGYLSFTPERSTEKGLDRLRTARILEENMIITNEPGIYFIPYLLDKAMADEKIKDYFVANKIKEYYDFGGVRIEDDILITADGCKTLTEGIPRTVEEIEKVMSEQ